jgi:hypothetical protein
MDPKTKQHDKSTLTRFGSLRQSMLMSSERNHIADSSPQLPDTRASPEDLYKTAPDSSPSECVRRVVGSTVDKLGRSKTLGSKSPGTRRMFSLNRGRDKEPSPGADSECRILLLTFINIFLFSASKAQRQTLSSSGPVAHDDSPFVRPSSPTTTIRPPLNTFPDDGPVSFYYIFITSLLCSLVTRSELERKRSFKLLLQCHGQRTQIMMTIS